MKKVTPDNYENPELKQFVRNMISAGLEPYHYFGRYSWEGPAVNVDFIQEAQDETDIAVQFDNMGKGFVVYPVTKGKLFEPPAEKFKKEINLLMSKISAMIDAMPSKGNKSTDCQKCNLFIKLRELEDAIDSVEDSDFKA